MPGSEDYFDVKTALEESLDLIDSLNEASFFAQGEIGEINPGLSIDQIGSIGVPISEHDAKRMISTSKQAPFGKGRETYVNTSVRRTWEIDSNRIRLGHSKWPSQLQVVVDSVAKQLGIVRGAQGVRAELYKLLVYESGAMFKAHTEYVYDTG